jgi:hypothetical protein
MIYFEIISACNSADQATGDTECSLAYPDGSKPHCIADGSGKCVGNPVFKFTVDE